MSSDDIVGLPCKQLANGCVGKMTRGKCTQGKNEGKEFLACEDRDWHEEHKEFPGAFMWTNQKSVMELYANKAKQGFLEAPKPKGEAAKAADPAPSSGKRVASDNLTDCRAVLIDINMNIRSLHQTQSEMLEFFKTEFKRAKKSSGEDEGPQYE